MQTRSIYTSVGTYGAKLGYDSYTDKAKRHWTNFVLHTPAGAKFLEMDESGTEAHDANDLAAHLITQIEKLGPENVVCIVADGASVRIDSARSGGGGCAVEIKLFWS